MARFLIPSSTGDAMVINLKEGPNRLGRDADNDFRIEDVSISGHHCEVNVTPEGVWFRDLGSTNGTYLDDQPIQQAWVLPGQTLRLGTVPMRLEEEAAPVAVGEESHRTQPPLPKRISYEGSPTGPSSDACIHHPSTPAVFICYACARLFCARCVKTTHVHLKAFHSCPACGATAGSLTDYRRRQARSDQTFFQLVLGVFKYPFKDSGAVIMVSGAIFFTLLDWATFLAKYALVFGAIGLLVLAIVSGGYFFAFMKGVAASAATGEDAPPRWPEFSSFGETFVLPFFQLAAIVVACVGPGVVAMRYFPPAAGMALIVCGLFCMPMVLLTVSVADGLGGLNPVIIFSSICKIPGQYLLVCLVFLLLLATRTGLDQFLKLAGIGPFAAFGVNLCSLYGATVEMRLLGLLYFKNKEQLAWL